MQLLKRTVSCISPEDHQQQHPCFTKLLKAVTDKDLNTFKRIFVDKELTINYQEPVRGNRSALHYAAKGNFREGLQYLVLNDANCNIQDNSGVTPLHLAANEGFPDIARELICNGASVEIADNRGRNALHWALTTSSSVTEDSNDDILKVVKMLLLRCNNASVKDNEGRLPLHLAARSGITAAVQLLLNNPKSGSVSAKDDELLTPLHYAVMGAQSLETVSFLIKRGANLDAVDKNGQTPMHLLVGRKPANVNEEFDIACLEILLNNGASVSIADRLYMLLLIGFAFGFHVLLRPYQTFYSLFVSLSTTFVMMTGELDYEAVFVEGKKSTEILGILLLLFFIFLIYIILSNLLVGLAVSDLTSIRKRSEVMRLCSQVELMVQFEEVVRSNLWPKCIKNIMKNSISLQALCDSPIISILPNKKRGWVTTSYKFLESFIPKRALNKIFESFVDGFIPPEWEPRLPDNLLRACLKIAQKQFEMQKRDRLLKQRRNTSRGNTVIAKMPVPKPKTDFSLTAIPIPGVSMHDAEDEDSDDSTDSSHNVSSDALNVKL
ncbi:hypothetical protein HAZT_HAZT007004 [Hyalella azteca]|uniref:Ion transport domain-containing protein n=1 Tax=Hyalella azteca TaxID=294128 RepID=A0A6A0H893_HYAAZ|nr:hypothetical protein HAZT_HAZT007004 [Hyalella azteca]